MATFGYGVTVANEFGNKDIMQVDQKSIHSGKTFLDPANPPRSSGRAEIAPLRYQTWFAGGLRWV